MRECLPFPVRSRTTRSLLISAISISGDSQPKPKTYQSLLDTGAQATLISKKVVTDVGLSAIGDSYMTPVSGEPIRTDKYMVRIDITDLQRGRAARWPGRYRDRDARQGHRGRIAFLSARELRRLAGHGLSFGVSFHHVWKHLYPQQLVDNFAGPTNRRCRPARLTTGRSEPPNPR